MKQLTLQQLLAFELLTGKQCTLQGKPRVRPRTAAQDRKLGIPPEHREVLLDIRCKNSKLREILRALKS